MCGDLPTLRAELCGDGNVIAAATPPARVAAGDAIYFVCGAISMISFCCACFMCCTSALSPASSPCCMVNIDHGDRLAVMHGHHGREVLVDIGGEVVLVVMVSAPSVEKHSSHAGHGGRMNLWQPGLDSGPWSRLQTTGLTTAKAMRFT